MKTLDIALKDIRLSFRNRNAIIFMFAIPVLITVLFYFMFGTVAGGGGVEIPQTAVVVVNLDTGTVPEGTLPTQSELPTTDNVDLSGVDSMGELLVRLLQSETMEGMLSVTTLSDAAAAHQAVDHQQASVAVIIPSNFTQALTTVGETAAVELYSDPTLTIGPAIVKSIVGQLVDALAAANIGIGVTVEQLSEAGVAINPQLVGEVVDRYKAAMGSGSESSTQLVTVQAPPIKDGQSSELAQMLALILGGMMVFYAFFTGGNVLHSILTEEENWTLQRLFTTSTSHLAIFSGKFIAALLILTIQVTVLLLFGRLVFGIHWGQPLPLVLAAVGVIIISATAGLFLVSLMKTSRQAGIIFGGLLTLTGMLGLFPVFTAGLPNTPAALETAALFVPQGWAVRGLRQAMEGASLNDLLLTLAVILLWSVALFVIGQRRLQRRFA
jgi:ABC-2 type transport system permease protein